jgi:putative GTP pyrophosphokinase
VTDPRNADEYLLATELLESFGADLEKLIKEILREEKIEVHSVTHRVKSRTSVQRKLTTGGGERLVGDLTDLLGLRVITYFPDQVDGVSAYIEEQFEVDEANSTDKRALLDPDRFGYLSRHFIVRIGASRRQLPEWARHAEVRFEIQIRSILQHAWAEIEHDLGYKREAAIPRELRRRFSRLAELLELADAEFQSIRDELARYAGDVEVTLREGRDAPLDQSSLLALLESNPAVQRLDQLIADSCEAALSPIDPKYVGDRSVDLQRAGLSSTNALLNQIEALETPVVAFAVDWLKRPRSRDEILSPDFDHEKGSYAKLPAGISLVYLERYLKLKVGEVTDDMVRDKSEAPLLMSSFKRAELLENR